MNPISPTPFPDVNEILSLLFSNVEKILRDQLAGMYLYGSLATGGDEPVRARSPVVEEVVRTQPSEHLDRGRFGTRDQHHVLPHDQLDHSG